MSPNPHRSTNSTVQWKTSLNDSHPGPHHSTNSIVQCSAAHVSQQKRGWRWKHSTIHLRTHFFHTICTLTQAPVRIPSYSGLRPTFCINTPFRHRCGHHIFQVARSAAWFLVPEEGFRLYVVKIKMSRKVNLGVYSKKRGFRLHVAKNRTLKFFISPPR